MLKAPSPEVLNEIKSAFSEVGLLPADKLILYAYALMELNKETNITGAKTYFDITLKHIADVCRCTQTMEGGEPNIVDVGSGGGIPGIILAILHPSTQVHLVERRTKKADALREMIRFLKLPNVVVIQRSFEEVYKTFPEDSEFWFRGFLPGPKFITYLDEYFHSRQLKRLILMKGPGWNTEKAEIQSLSKIRDEWKQRFSESVELDYELPLNAGSRILVLL